MTTIRKRWTMLVLLAFGLAAVTTACGAQSGRVPGTGTEPPAGEEAAPPEEGEEAEASELAALREEIAGLRGELEGYALAVNQRDEAQREAIEDLQKRVDALGERVDELEAGRVDPDDVMTDLAALIRAAGQAGISVSTEVWKIVWRSDEPEQIEGLSEPVFRFILEGPDGQQVDACCVLPGTPTPELGAVGIRLTNGRWLFPADGGWQLLQECEPGGGLRPTWTPVSGAAAPQPTLPPGVYIIRDGQPIEIDIHDLVDITVYPVVERIIIVGWPGEIPDGLFAPRPVCCLQPLAMRGITQPSIGDALLAGCSTIMLGECSSVLPTEPPVGPATATWTPTLEDTPGPGEPTWTPSPTLTGTSTRTSTPTVTATATLAPTLTETVEPSPVPSDTPVPPGASSTPTSDVGIFVTDTPVPPGANPTATAAPDNGAQQPLGCFADKIATYAETWLIFRRDPYRVELGGSDGRMHSALYRPGGLEVSFINETGEVGEYACGVYGSQWQFADRDCRDFDVVGDAVRYARDRGSRHHSGLVYAWTDFVAGRPPLPGGNVFNVPQSDWPRPQDWLCPTGTGPGPTQPPGPGYPGP